MRLSLVLASAAAASCWVLPPDLEDGFYTVSLADSAGGEGGPEAVLIKREEWAPAPDTLDTADLDTADGMRRRSEAAVPAPPRLRFRYEPRLPVPVSRSDCMAYGRALPVRGYRQARAALEAYSGSYLVPGRTAHVSVARNGTVAAFTCNLSKEAQPCLMAEFDWIERHFLDKHCGTLRAGQAYVWEWRQWYGRAALGMQICPLRKPWSQRPKLREMVWYGMPEWGEAGDPRRVDGGSEA